MLKPAFAVLVILIGGMFVLPAYGPYHYGDNSDEQTEKTQTSIENPTIKGKNMDILIEPFPFDTEKNDVVKMTFGPKAEELAGSEITPGTIDHLDYEVTISKGGEEIWSNQFHDHDGKLVLNIDTSASGGVSGRQENDAQTTTGPYTLNKKILNEHGDYTVTAKIVGIEFNPLPKPLSDKFTLNVVPEFGVYAVLALVVSITAVVMFTRKNTFSVRS